MKIKQIFIVFLFQLFFFKMGYKQNIAEDSLKIEQTFLQAIGKPKVLDSLQKIEFSQLKKKKNNYNQS